jgi:ligand-binding SRPBCC domain-containing protein
MNAKIFGSKVKIPTGWRRVCRGKIRAGDKHATLINIGTPKPLKNLKWQHVSSYAASGGVSMLGFNDVKEFYCVIRKEKHENQS